MIYVLGSLNRDFVANTRVPKKGETVLADEFKAFCGGKGGNQAVAAARLGGRVKMIACVGDDENGRALKGYLQRCGVDTEFVFTKGENSGLAMIWVEKGDNRIVVCKGANDLITETDIDDALCRAQKGDILAAQLEIPVQTVAYAFKKAKRIGMITVLNPAPAVSELPCELFKNTDIITPNETETQILTGINPVDIVHSALAVKAFYSLGVASVIITLGIRGSMVSVGQEITPIPARKVKVTDTTGAGDTFVGAVCERLAAGTDLVSACRFAAAASSITVQRKGAGESIPTREEVEQIL